MVARQATLLVADDARIALTGKFDISGIYTSDIMILTDPTVAPQLVFLFLVETDLSEPFKSLVIEIKLPGSDPIRLPPLVIPPIGPAPSGRTRQLYRWPQLVQSALLRPGKIEAKIIHESGEIVIGGPWISLVTPSAPIPAPTPAPKVEG
jgi:hypothetical protein